MFWNFAKDEDKRVLRLEGPIDSDNFWGDEVTPQAFREELYADKGDITVYINSPGGNVFAAAEIYTMLKEYPGEVEVKIASIAASAASVIAMAGDVVTMSPTALLMIHDPSTIAMGNAQEMEKVIESLKEVKESIINAYEFKTGLPRKQIAKLMSDETWLNAKKAVELGFADEVMFAGGDDGGEPEDKAAEWQPYSARAQGQKFLAKLLPTARGADAATTEKPVEKSDVVGGMPFTVLMDKLYTIFEE